MKISIYDKLKIKKQIRRSEHSLLKKNVCLQTKVYKKKRNIPENKNINDNETLQACKDNVLHQVST
jgi:hypothetical protein